LVVSKAEKRADLTVDSMVEHLAVKMVGSKAVQKVEKTAHVKAEKRADSTAELKAVELAVRTAEKTAFPWVGDLVARTGLS